MIIDIIAYNFKYSPFFLKDNVSKLCVEVKKK